MGAAAWARNLVLGLTLTLAAGAIPAQTSGGSINVVPINSRYGYTTPTGVATSTSVRASFRAAQMPQSPVPQTRYFSVPVAYTAARLGQMAKGLLRGVPSTVVGGLIVSGIINGAGWAINELTKQVEVPASEEPEELGPHAYCIEVPNGGTMRCASAMGQLVGAATALYATPPYSAPCRHQMLGNASGYQCWVEAEQAYGWRIFERVVPMPAEGWPTGANANPQPQPTPVTDEALGIAIAQSPNAQSAVNQLLNDPQGRPYNTPELAAALNALQQQLAAQSGYTPTPVAPPSGNPDDPPESTPPDPANEGSEWPEFCDYATVVCEFIDWFKGGEEEAVELPQADVPITSDTWSSGWGNGSCPAPEVVDIEVAGSHGSASFEWQPVCDFAVMMRPFLIAACLVVAALILAGLRGGITK